MSFPIASGFSIGAASCAARTVVESKGSDLKVSWSVDKLAGSQPELAAEQRADSSLIELFDKKWKNNISAAESFPKVDNYRLLQPHCRLYTVYIWFHQPHAALNLLYSLHHFWCLSGWPTTVLFTFSLVILWWTLKAEMSMYGLDSLPLYLKHRRSKECLFCHNIQKLKTALSLTLKGNLQYSIAHSSVQLLERHLIGLAQPLSFRWTFLQVIYFWNHL